MSDTNTKVIVNRSILVNIADAVRRKNGTTSEMTLAEIAAGAESGGGENLDAELAQQDTLITELSDILDTKAAGGSGGGSVETCTLSVVYTDGPYSLACTRFIDGRFSSHTVWSTTGSLATINDVMCGSVLSIGTNFSSLVSCDGADPICDLVATRAYAFEIVANKGETVTIEIYED